MSYARRSRQVINSKRWKAVRLEALRRDGFRCVKCGGVGRLQVDHIKRVEPHNPELWFDLDNLQSLCGTCHSRKTAIEVGITPLDPQRQAWRELVRDMRQHNHEVR